ncbi:MAG TPA: xanthine dehydrogenase family protein subunit M [Vicinamibacterales bacterium]|nr:xanthine dehydrogenase family protein subunit M [Vicinamibacterales bacterium]
MIPTEFDYQRATSVDDALSKLAASNGAAKLLAGGHSLVPLMKLRLSEPQTLIDIGRIPELSGIRDEGVAIEIGAGTVHHAVATSALVAEACPALAEAAAAIGDQQVRNRGTMGGSVAHADPAADYPAALIALGAEIRVKGPKGARAVKAEDFFVDLFTVDLAPDEIVTAVRVPKVKASAYAKLVQRASHFAIVGVAAAVEVKGGAFASARIGLTGASSHAIRLAGVEKLLVGKKATDATIAAAAEQAAAGVDPVNGDIHASEAYRRAMIGVFVKRALSAAVARSA